MELTQLVSNLDLSQLHVGQQNRIRALQLDDRELSLLLSGNNHGREWKTRTIVNYAGKGAHLEQLLPLMHAQTRLAIQRRFDFPGILIVANNHLSNSRSTRMIVGLAEFLFTTTS